MVKSGDNVTKNLEFQPRQVREKKGFAEVIKKKVESKQSSEAQQAKGIIRCRCGSCAAAQGLLFSIGPYGTKTTLRTDLFMIYGLYVFA